MDRTMNQTEPLRICSVQAKGILEILPNTKHFGGMMAYYGNTIIDLGLGDLVNYTLDASDSIGSLKNASTGEYDGCIGMIQRDEADYAAVGSRYEEAPINTIQWEYIGEDQLAIVSAYHKNESTKTFPDALDNVNNFDRKTWTLVLLTVLLFYLMFKWCMWLTNRFKAGPKVKQNALNEVLSHVINQETTDWDYLRLNLLSVGLTISISYIILFYTNLMSTDLVIVNPPPVVKTYSDIIQQDLGPEFIPMLKDIEMFQNAKSGSIERQIYEAVHRKMPRLITRKTTSHQQIFENGFRIADRKAVLITSLLLTEAIAGASCIIKADELKDTYGHVYMYTSIDPASKPFYRTSLFARNFTKTSVFKIVKRRLRRVIEHGHNVVIRRQLYSTYKEAPWTADFIECIQTGVVWKEEASVGAFGLSILNKTIFLCMIFDGSAFIVLTYEKFSSKKRKLVCIRFYFMRALVMLRSKLASFNSQGDHEGIQT